MKLEMDGHLEETVEGGKIREARRATFYENTMYDNSYCI